MSNYHSTNYLLIAKGNLCLQRKDLMIAIFKKQSNLQKQCVNLTLWASNGDTLNIQHLCDGLLPKNISWEISKLGAGRRKRVNPPLSQAWQLGNQRASSEVWRFNKRRPPFWRELKKWPRSQDNFKPIMAELEPTLCLDKSPRVS